MCLRFRCACFLLFVSLACCNSQVGRHLGVDLQSGLSLLEVSVRQGLVPPNELEKEEEVRVRSPLSNYNRNYNRSDQRILDAV